MGPNPQKPQNLVPAKISSLKVIIFLAFGFRAGGLVLKHLTVVKIETKYSHFDLQYEDKKIVRHLKNFKVKKEKS